MNQVIKVLMVDDEDRFRETTKRVLEKRGFEMLLAASGREAIARLSENPEVVVLDIKMPDMDGHETLAQIKALHPELPVIMLTGHGTLPSAREALNFGAFDYLSKPCDITLLSSKIRDAHQRARNHLAAEKTVADVMVPLSEYTVLEASRTIRAGIRALKDSFTDRLTTSRLMETGHRSILVKDADGALAGILSIQDLMLAIMPPYLSAPKPSTADSLQYSPMFWSSMFTEQVRHIGKQKIHDVMSPPPATIDAHANLMEAAHTMLTHNARRLAVFKGLTLIGVIREQDLFFEMEKILN